MVKFSSNKVGLVHKYHNHGLKCPTISRVQSRSYSTGHKCKGSSVLFVQGASSATDTQLIPFVETRQISGSRLILTQMLAYFSSVKSPLYGFLSTHTRVLYLTGTNPYPSVSLLTELSDIVVEYATPVLSVVNPAVMPLSSVYLIGHPGSLDFYIGSRIAGSNRSSSHRSELRSKIRDNVVNPGSSNLSLLQRFVVNLGGFANAT